MAIQTITGITASNAQSFFLKTIATQALEALLGKLVMGKLVSRKYENYLQQAGDSVTIATPPQFAQTNAMGLSGVVSPQTPTPGTLNVTLNYHPEVSFFLPDAVATLSAVNLMELYFIPAVNKMAETIEQAVLASYVLFTANSTLGGSTALGESSIVAGEKALFDAKISPAQPRRLIIGSNAYSSLSQTGRLTEWNAGGYTVAGPGMESPIASNKLIGGDDGTGSDGKIHGVYVYRSQYVPVVSSVAQNMLFTEDALTLVMKKLPLTNGEGVTQQSAALGGYELRVTSAYIPTQLGRLIIVDCMFGTTALRNEAGVVIQSL